MSPYYTYMADELLPQVPVLTAYTHYRAADGSYYQYSEETPYKEALNTYHYMEYNTVKGGSECVDGLFHLR